LPLLGWQACATMPSCFPLDRGQGNLTNIFCPGWPRITIFLISDCWIAWDDMSVSDFNACEVSYLIPVLFNFQVFLKFF
jgi:hypothetical protein